MVQKAMDYIKSTIASGQFVLANIMASKGKESFYSQFGFEERPTEDLGAGMTQWLYFNGLNSELEVKFRDESPNKNEQ